MIDSDKKKNFYFIKFQTNYNNNNIFKNKMNKGIVLLIYILALTIS